MEITGIPTDGYEKVLRCRDEASGLHALIAVHDTTLGPALGGMRMLPYPSEEEALFDVLRLAKGMTNKSAVADTGLGGGKSVVIGDPAQDKSEALFRTMGRFVDSLGGKYITAEDMNISIPDLEIVRQETRWVTGLSRKSGSSGNPSPYTAYGVVVGMRAALLEEFGSDSFEGRHVLIQGVGAVGGRLAEMLLSKGARVTICDISEERVAELKQEHPEYGVVEDDVHLETECDIYAPCARGEGINDQTIPRLRCRIVAGAANNQLLQRRHAKDLRARGILYVPDYVINAGGIINVSCELLPDGYHEKTAFERIERIGVALKQVFEISRTEDIPTNDASLRLAERRLEAGRRQSASADLVQ